MNHICLSGIVQTVPMGFTSKNGKNFKKVKCIHHNERGGQLFFEVLTFGGDLDELKPNDKVIAAGKAQVDFYEKKDGSQGLTLTIMANIVESFPQAAEPQVAVKKQQQWFDPGPGISESDIPF